MSQLTDMSYQCENEGRIAYFNGVRICPYASNTFGYDGWWKGWHAVAFPSGAALVNSYGGGTNSTAVLCGMAERGIMPDLSMFADTGDERPETYDHLEVMQDWCLKMGFPPITIVRNELPQGLIDGSLYGECMRLGTMPSKTFGYSTCSMKWKVTPQQKYLEEWRKERAYPHVNHIIGYDADEIARSQKPVPIRAWETNLYLLIEWGWGRDECIDAIRRFGLPQPGKSACFMCPSSKKPEVVRLKEKHPALYMKAIEMERRALAGEGRAPAASSGTLPLPLPPGVYKVDIPLSAIGVAQGYARFDGVCWYRWRLDYRVAQDETIISKALSDASRGCIFIATVIDNDEGVTHGKAD